MPPQIKHVRLLGSGVTSRTAGIQPIKHRTFGTLRK